MVHLHGVDSIAHAQQCCGAERGSRRAAARNDANEGELRAAREHEQAERHGLAYAEAGGHGQGAERDAVEPGGGGDGQAHAGGWGQVGDDV